MVIMLPAQNMLEVTLAVACQVILASSANLNFLNVQVLPASMKLHAVTFSMATSASVQPVLPVQTVRSTSMTAEVMAVRMVPRVWIS